MNNLFFDITKHIWLKKSSFLYLNKKIEIDGFCQKPWFKKDMKIILEYK